MNKNIKTGLLMLAVVGLYAAQVASGAPVAANSVIQLTDSYGTNSGGEFLATVVGGSGSGDTFLTFCVEHNETFSYGQSLYVKAVNTGAVNGGNSTADNGFVGTTSPTSIFDPISFQTAYLFTQFSNHTLSNYQFLADTQAHIDERTADGTSLQRAFWYLEAEGDFGYSTDAQAQAWVTEATNAHWTNLGNVQVLNLYKDAAFTQVAQDQLYITPVPEPEIYAMMAAGLGLMGWVARRRKQQGA
jgi:hypothetical protein